MKGEILMGKIYGYSLTVSTRGKCAERLEEQKKAIKEIYTDAEIIEEVMGLEKFNRCSNGIINAISHKYRNK